MKTILCYGDSNIWGNIPGSFNQETGLSRRYPKLKRWTGLLQKRLGKKYHIVEEGINGRTTTLDEIVPGRPYKNGLTLLPACLEAHYPIDLVIFMLGTNDTKIQFNRSSEEITAGMRKLINIVQTCNKGLTARAPAAQPILKIVDLHPQLDDSSIAKSRRLGPLYQKMAQEEKCEFLDASLVITSSKIDGIHLDESQCKLLAHAVAEKVICILEPPISKIA
jgi:lysophospholipase L1-like esterase